MNTNTWTLQYVQELQNQQQLVILAIGDINTYRMFLKQHHVPINEGGTVSPLMPLVNWTQVTDAHIFNMSGFLHDERDWEACFTNYLKETPLCEYNTVILNYPIEDARLCIIEMDVYQFLPKFDDWLSDHSVVISPDGKWFFESWDLHSWDIRSNFSIQGGQKLGIKI